MKSIRSRLLFLAPLLTSLFLVAFQARASLVQDAGRLELSENATDNLHYGHLDVTKVPPLQVSEIEETPKPDATPSGQAGDATFDGNDSIALGYTQKLQLNINGLVVKTIYGDATMHLSLHDSSGTPIATYAMTVYVRDAGHYDLRLPDYDTSAMTMELTVSDGSGNKSYSLPAKSRILFAADSFEGQLFDGSAQAAEGATPNETVDFPATKFTNIMVAPGDLLIRVKGTDSVEPTPEASPEASPIVTNPNPNPPTNSGSGNNNASGSTDTPLSPPIGAAGNLGGGGGVFNCSLPSLGGSGNLLDLLALLAPGLWIFGRPRQR